jgi:hypothetical protein
VTEAKSCGAAPAEFACEAGNRATGATEQKAVNLSRNAHVILMTGCNQWESGLDVVVEGDAEQITDDHVLERLG